jgi:hypothetical protein
MMAVCWSMAVTCWRRRLAWRKASRIPARSAAAVMAVRSSEARASRASESSFSVGLMIS